MKNNDKFNRFMGNIPVPLQNILAILAFIALLTQLLGVQKPIWEILMFKWLWSGRSKWVADCPRDNETYFPPDIAWNKSLGARWTQARQQRVGDYFSLDLHKSRTISKIELVNDNLGRPIKYKLIIKNNKGKSENVGEFEEPIDISLNPPRKIRAFRIEITVPKLEPKDIHGWSPAWSIYDVRLTEVRLFGKWWHKVIGD